MRTRLHKITAILFFCCFLHVATSQNLQISPAQPLGTNDFDGVVNCFLQDKFGFIWIGNATGLFSYDGYQAKKFRNIAADSVSISANNISSIAQDSTGDLWIGTKGGGLNHFNRKTETFTRYLHDKNNTNSISFDEVSAICPDGKGNFWIGTDGGGLNFFDPQKGKFINVSAKFSKDKGFRSNNILQIVPSGNGKYWVTTWGGGFHLFDPEANKVTTIGEGTRFERANVFSVKEVKPNLLWVATYNDGLVSYDIARKQFAQVVPKAIAPITKDIQVTAKGEIYVASYNGLIYFSSVDSGYRFVQNENIRLGNINKVYIDKAQNIWVGTVNGVVAKINSFRKNFHTFQQTSLFHQSYARSVFVDKVTNLIYFTSGNELVRFNYSLNQFKTFKLPLKRFITIVEVPKTNLLLCVGLEGTATFNRSNEKVTSIKFNGKTEDNVLKSRIISLYPADSLSFWFAGSSEAFLIDLNLITNTWAITKTVRIADNGGISKSHYLTCFLKHPNGDFWIGNWGGGVNRQIAGKVGFTQIKYAPGQKSGISNNFIECMAAGQNGNVWVGTQAGLNVFDIRTSTFRSIKVDDGLADDWIIAINTSHPNQVWAASRGGLSLISTEGKVVRNFDINDGLPDCAFLPQSTGTDGNGFVYFGTENGLVWFHPDSIRYNPYLPNAAIVEIKINDKPLSISSSSPLKQSIGFTHEIKLTHKQNSFSLQMAALSFSNPKRNKLKYKLTGYDTDWQFAGSDQTAKYSEIPPGKYTFSVLAANDDGIWNPQPRNINIIIAQPPWWSYQAILVYVAIVLGGLLYFYKRSLKANTGKPLQLGGNINNSATDLVQPSNVVLEPTDKLFLQKALQVVEDNMSDSDFGVEQFCDKMLMSRYQLYSKIDSITKLTALEFIKEVRLKRAAQLLVQKPESVADIAYAVGFSDPRYFRKCFKQKFGVAPTQYAMQNQQISPPK